MTKYWDCDETPPKLVKFIDKQVGKALKHYVQEELSFFDRLEEDRIVVRVSLLDNEGPGQEPLGKDFDLSEELLLDCTSGHPEDLDIVKKKAIALRSIAEKMEKFIEHEEKENRLNPLRWVMPT